MRGVALTAAVAVALVLVSPARAAAPNYILVSGPGVPRPILLDDWAENLVVLTSLVDARRAPAAVLRGLARRPRLDLAEFWGWFSLPRPTRPSQATQHGWFYPAHRSRPPVVDVMVDGKRVPRLVSARVLRIFARHGVPTHLPAGYGRR